MKAVLIAAAMLAVTGTAAAAGAEPAAAKVCLGCHQIDKKVFGPSFKDVSAALKKKDAAKAEETIVNVIHNGSKGVWGTFAMPAQTQVKPEDAKALAKWILSL